MFFFVDGHDVRRCPLHERKELLGQVLGDTPSERIVFVDYLVGQGAELLAAVEKIGAEGIVSKRLGSIYRGGDSKDWVKTKCSETGTFYITGLKELGRPIRGTPGFRDAQWRATPAGHVQLGFAGKGLWEMLDGCRAGVARKGVVPIEPFLLADIRYYGRPRGWAIRGGVVPGCTRTCARENLEFSDNQFLGEFVRKYPYGISKLILLAHSGTTRNHRRPKRWRQRLSSVLTLQTAQTFRSRRYQAYPRLFALARA